MNLILRYPGWSILSVLLSACTVAQALAASVTGTIQQAGSPPIQLTDARVTLFDPALSYFQEARSGASGQYAFTNVPPGTWRLGACSRGLEYVEVGVTVGANSIQYDFTLVSEYNIGQWTIIGNTLPEFFDATDIAVLRPDGKVMFCHDTMDPVVFDTVTGQKTFPVGSGSPQGCMSGTVLQDGRILMAGGQTPDDPGSFTNAVPWVKTYSAQTNSWQQLADMQLSIGRWYPGMARLADGSLLVMGGGTRPNAVRTPTCERFDLVSQTWSYTGSMVNPCEFPPSALLHTGKVLATWSPPQLYNPSTGQWQTTGNFNQPNRGWPDHSDHSLVMLADGRALAVGCRRPSGTNNSVMGEIYDPSSATWSFTANPGLVRFQTEVVQLPDGRVLSAGGEAQVQPPPVSNVLGIVKWSDLYDPATNAWRRVADMNWFREYHAVTLLVPDGRVVMTGGTRIKFQYGPTTADIEAFEPPYLFRGVRPQITQVSTTQPRRGQTISLTVFPTTTLTNVVLMGCAATTHWVDGGVPRRLVLPVQQTGSTVCVTMPDSGSVLPLGHYMLIAMVDDIPSVAQIIRVNNDAASTPGDFNGSGRVDLADVTPFVNVLLGLDDACERVSIADANSDGIADGNDIQPFVLALLVP